MVRDLSRFSPKKNRSRVDRCLKTFPVVEWSRCLRPMLVWLRIKLFKVLNSCQSRVPLPLESNIWKAILTERLPIDNKLTRKTKSVKVIKDCSPPICSNIEGCSLESTSEQGKFFFKLGQWQRRNLSSCKPSGCFKPKTNKRCALTQWKWFHSHPD